MAKVDVGLYVVMAILAMGFLIALWKTLETPTQINIYLTAGTFIGTAILIAIALYRGRK